MTVTVLVAIVLGVSTDTPEVTAKGPLKLGPLSLDFSSIEEVVSDEVVPSVEVSGDEAIPCREVDGAGIHFEVEVEVGKASERSPWLPLTALSVVKDGSTEVTVLMNVLQDEVKVRTVKGVTDGTPTHATRPCCTFEMVSDWLAPLDTTAFTQVCVACPAHRLERLRSAFSPMMEGPDTQENLGTPIRRLSWHRKLCHLRRGTVEAVEKDGYRKKVPVRKYERCFARLI